MHFSAFCIKIGVERFAVATAPGAPDGVRLFDFGGNIVIYSKAYLTRWHDTDASRVLRPSAMLTYFEETADLHVRSVGKSLDAMRDENKVGFILSRMTMVFHRPVAADAELLVQTFTCEGHGFSTRRDFRAIDGDEVVAEATSTWALVDVESKRPIRIANAPFEFRHEAPLTIDAPVRVMIPKDLELEKVGERRIAYSDIDYNLHMNNTRYPDMLCDFMPNMSGKRMRRVTMSFLHEAALSHTLSVYRAEQNGIYYFRTLDGDCVCLEAEVEIENV